MLWRRTKTYREQKFFPRRSRSRGNFQRRRNRLRSWKYPLKGGTASVKGGARQRAAPRRKSTPHYIEQPDASAKPRVGNTRVSRDSTQIERETEYAGRPSFDGNRAAGARVGARAAAGARFSVDDGKIFNRNRAAGAFAGARAAGDARILINNSSHFSSPMKNYSNGRGSEKFRFRKTPKNWVRRIPPRASLLRWTYPSLYPRTAKRRRRREKIIILAANPRVNNTSIAR